MAPEIVLKASQELGYRLADSGPLLRSVMNTAGMRLMEPHSRECQDKQKSEGEPDVAGGVAGTIGSLVLGGTMADSSTAVLC